MPNTSPACDSPETVHYIKQTARQASARVYPIAAATRSLAGEELTDLRSLHSAGAVAVSDDGRPVATAALMKTVMETAAALGMPVLAHCEEPVSYTHLDVYKRQHNRHCRLTPTAGSL